MKVDSSNTNLSDHFLGKRAVVLGGTGFVGCALVDSLLDLGCDVTVVSRGTLETSKARCRQFRIDISKMDVDQRCILAEEISRVDMLFNLSGKSGATATPKDLSEFVSQNLLAQQEVLEICHQVNPQLRIVYTSSRLVYGKPVSLPIDELHPTEPTSVYGISKLAAEKIHALYSNAYSSKVSVVRLSNAYGLDTLERPYSHGIVNHFIKVASAHGTVRIFGGGKQLRDIIHIDDVVSGLLAVASCEQSIGEVYNMGCGIGKSLWSIAEFICSKLKSGKIESVPWPKDAYCSETGDSFLSIQKIANHTGWKPRLSPELGLSKVCDEYMNKSQ